MKRPVCYFCVKKQKRKINTAPKVCMCFWFEESVRKIQISVDAHEICTCAFEKEQIDK